jgi:putative ABC transport system permease protein
MQVSLPSVRYGDADRIRVFFDRALEAVRTQPGVRSAAVATALPLRGPALLMHFEVGGRYAANDAERPLAPYQVVSPDYFAAMGISLRSGRSFLETDDERGLPVAIVNDAFARRFLEGHDPLKTHVRIDSLVPGHNRLGPRLDRVIVGVTTDVKVTSLGENGEPEIYVPLAQSPWPSAQFVVRTETEPLVAAASLRRAIQSIDPAQPVANVRTLDRVVRDATAHARFRALLLGSFAGIALLLIAVGVYGVISHAASQRRREFGIRIAIGGQSAQILWMIARHGLMMTGFGIVIGLGLSVIAMRGLSTFLFGVHPADPWIMAGVAVLLAAVGLAASLIPARRALRVDPIEVLRQD